MLQSTKYLLCAAILSGCQSIPATNPTASPNETPAISLTVYSSADPATFDPQMLFRPPTGTQFDQYVDFRVPGFGVVRDTRHFTLRKGVNTMSFTDVAAGIDPTTVSLRMPGAEADISVLEQNFRFDLLSPDKLLKKYIGKSVIVHSGAREGQDAAVKGTLVAFTSSDLVVQVPGGGVQIVPRSEAVRGRVELDRLATGLVTKPTLDLMVTDAKGGERSAEVTYQTDNLTWRTDYSLVLNDDDTAATVSSWVTLLNQSGANYPNAHLKLIAGDVRRYRQGLVSAGNGLAGNAASPGFIENPLFEYHLYTLDRTTSLPDNSVKQVELFAPRKDVKVTKSLVFDVQEYAKSSTGMGLFDTNFNMPDEVQGKVEVRVRLKNTEANHLGIPLPAGRVRLYKAGPDGAAEFIGEDVIDHTPRDETLSVRVGQAFDVLGKRVCLEIGPKDSKDRVTWQTFEVTLRNHKTTPVTVVVQEVVWQTTATTGGWKVAECSEPYQIDDATRLLIPLEVPAGGEKKVKYKLAYDPTPEEKK